MPDLRVVAISDTHGMHRRVNVPAGDVLIHCGDFCNHGDRYEVEDFADWLSGLPHKHKMVTAGNHDAHVARNPADARALFEQAGVTLLLDEEIVVDGVKFWGSPITPRFGNWDFMKDRGAPLAAHWSLIPGDADVVITHGPAFGVCDLVPPYGGRGLPKHAGCVDLLNRLREIKAVTHGLYPRYHLCGHIHNGHGAAVSDEFGDLTFVNAAICTEDYEPTNRPISFSIETLKRG